MHPVVESKRREVAALCLRLGVKRLELFGSGARDDFDAARSDIDMLVEFNDDPALRAWSNDLDLKQSLGHAFARPVDLVERVLVHGYASLLPERTWSSIRDDLPRLHTLAEQLLAGAGSSELPP